MNKSEYEILNERFDKFVYGDLPVCEEDIIFEEKLCDIILKKIYIQNDDNCFKRENMYDTKIKVSKNMTISICNDFFSRLDSNYGNLLNEIIESGMVVFKKADDIYDRSYIDMSEIDKIVIKTYDSVEDILTLAHEFMHYTNTRSELATPVTSYYTEALSNWAEFILVDFIKENYPKYKKDILKMQRNIFTSLYEENIKFKFLIELIKNKIDGFNINDYLIVETTKKILKDCSDYSLIVTCFEELMNNILTEDEYSVEYTYISTLRNTVATVLSCYMYYNLDVKDILYLNNNLSSFNAFDVLKYMNFEFKKNDSLDLIDENYQILEKSYKEKIKKLW